MLDRPSEVYSDQSFKKRRLENTSCAQRPSDLEQNQVSDVSSSSRSSQQPQPHWDALGGGGGAEAGGAQAAGATGPCSWAGPSSQQTPTLFVVLFTRCLDWRGKLQPPAQQSCHRGSQHI
ncbi:hypothetical protein MRX96_055012 [Rhipicephalus microplus]